MLDFGLLAMMGALIFVIGGIVASEMDSAIMSVATFVIGLLTLQYGFGFGIWAMISSNPLWAFGFILLYVAAGAAYTALWRWPEFIRNNNAELMRDYSDWANRLEDSEDNSFDAFLDSDSYRFNAWQHKERLGTWVGMWPFSAAWELSRKPAIWIWNTAYASLGNLFQNVGRRTARNIHDRG